MTKTILGIKTTASVGKSSSSTKSKKVDTTQCSLVSIFSKKPTNERSPDRRSDANLSRGIYRPLEQRAIRDEPLLSRLHRGKRRLDVVDEDVKTYGQRDYERMYEV